MTFHCLTYNIQKGKRLQQILEWLPMLVPARDVICFQEFPKAHLQKTTRLLSKSGYGHSFSPAFNSKTETFGQLTLYRKKAFRLLFSKIIHLGHSGLENALIGSSIRRSGLVSYFSGSSGRVCFVNIHLVAYALNRNRYKQISSILEMLESPDGATIIAGDFNLSSIRGRRTLLSMMDKRGYVHGGIHLKTHRIGPIKHQLDYTFARKCEIRGMKTVPVTYSDHYPVLFTVKPHRSERAKGRKGG